MVSWACQTPKESCNGAGESQGLAAGVSAAAMHGEVELWQGVCHWHGTGCCSTAAVAVPSDPLGACTSQIAGRAILHHSFRDLVRACRPRLVSGPPTKFTDIQKAHNRNDNFYTTPPTRSQCSILHTTACPSPHCPHCTTTPACAHLKPDKAPPLTSPHGIHSSTTLTQTSD